MSQFHLPEILEILASHGANINSEDHNTQTLLDITLQSRDLEIIQILIRQGQGFKKIVDLQHLVLRNDFRRILRAEVSILGRRASQNTLTLSDSIVKKSLTKFSPKNWIFLSSERQTRHMLRILQSL